MVLTYLRNVKKKHKLWKKWKESSDDNVKIKYKKQVNKASKVVRLAKRDFERKIAKNIKKDSKTLNSSNMQDPTKTRVKSTIGPLIDDNDMYSSVMTKKWDRC